MNLIDFRGGQLEIHEFPYETDNEVIFKENGVVIRSFPAIPGAQVEECAGCEQNDSNVGFDHVGETPFS